MLRIPRCYDSHLHLVGTGELFSRMSLAHLRSAQELASVKILPEHRRGPWILGYGLPASAWGWPAGHATRLDIIDAWAGSAPTLLLGVDSHSGWVNTAALRLLGLDPKNHASGQVNSLVSGAKAFAGGRLHSCA
jgi:predicted amidohydrolase YtcJ